MTKHLKELFERLTDLSTEDRKLIMIELVRKYGVEFGVWEIDLKEKNNVLFINNRDDGHGFTFSKTGEFKIL